MLPERIYEFRRKSGLSQKSESIEIVRLFSDKVLEKEKKDRKYRSLDQESRSGSRSTKERKRCFRSKRKERKEQSRSVKKIP